MPKSPFDNRKKVYVPHEDGTKSFNLESKDNTIVEDFKEAFTDPSTRYELEKERAKHLNKNR